MLFRSQITPGGDRLAQQVLGLPDAIEPLEEERPAVAGAGEAGQELGGVARRQITPGGDGLAGEGLGLTRETVPLEERRQIVAGASEV